MRGLLIIDGKMQQVSLVEHTGICNILDIREHEKADGLSGCTYGPLSVDGTDENPYHKMRRK